MFVYKCIQPKTKNLEEKRSIFFVLLFNSLHFFISGVHLQEVTATISKDLVFEFFGKGPFKCECNAWSPRGKAKSQPATVEVACK